MRSQSSILISLMVCATVLPVFSGYTLCLVAMVYGVFLLNSKSDSLRFDSLFDRHYQIWWYSIPVFLLCLFGAEFAHVLGESQLNSKMVREFGHLLVKYCLLWFFPLVFLFYAMKSSRIRRTLAISLLILAVVHFSYCLVQRYTGINFREGFDAVLPSNRFAYGVYRINGFSNHPLTIGYQLCILVVTSFGLSFSRHFDKVENLSLKVASLFFIFTILISGSRGPQLVAILSCTPFLLFFSKTKRFVILGLLVPTVAAIGWKLGLLDRFKELGNLMASGDSRMMDLNVYWLAFSENPIFGLGINGFKQEILTYYQRLGGDGSIGLAHNMYLQVAAESGVLGLIGFLAWLGGWLVAVFRVRERSINLSLMCLFLMMVLSCLTQNSMRDSEVLYTLVFSTQTLLGIYCIDVSKQTG
jgi:O-antigen ligase